MALSKLATIFVELATSTVPAMRTLERGAIVEWHPEKNPRTVEVRRAIHDDTPEDRAAFKQEAAVFQREMAAAGINVMDDPQFFRAEYIGKTQLRAVWIVTSRTIQTELHL